MIDYRRDKQGRELPKDACPNCGKVNDAATYAADGSELRPGPGDIAVCIDCGHMQAFCADMRLRDLTDEEIYDLAGDPEVLAAQRVSALWRARKGPHQRY